MSKLRLSGWIVPGLIVSLLLAFLAIACTPPAASEPTKAVDASKWAVKPDAKGHYYAGNPDAKLVVEEWGDLQ